MNPTLVKTACLASSLATMASAMNLVRLGVGATDRGFENSFEQLLLACAAMQAFAGLLFLARRGVYSGMTLLIVNALVEGPQLFSPVPPPLIWDLAPIVALVLTATALGLVALRNRLGSKNIHRV